MVPLITGQELIKAGYTRKLVAAQFVKPYVKTNKNDKVDAEAICEAINRPNMRFVSVKMSKQQDIQSMHRVREELIAQRTARANQIRGLTAEYGIVAPLIRLASKSLVREVASGKEQR
ncbi:transposase [Vibrio crassostreae]|uniref:Transposase IS110-like N-terminal domain-containing protein n=1 Tax=Vibrio crassostreae TaxID=246167 RepID=A0A822MVR5_9VIBR|nr:MULTISPECIES: IS110 family transposase [Vibrio]MDH5939091.1 IS110 family transposase [Vibrio splendidus]CAK2136988.1 transposase [Vibrio crassostreae]CAK2359349.1 transposase [Vibrio crassostreae]CAK2369210.1 transposase [Vibrio crassostreae]CAK2510298.1 transposase [Vibrio crassostreae]